MHPDASTATISATGRERVARYPELPANWRKEERFYILGWNLDNTRLQELVRLHTPPSMAHASYAARAKYLLEELTGYGNLHISSVVSSENSHGARGEGKRTKTVVAISFTAETRLFFRRPSQRQYDLLVQILSEQPLWYQDALPKYFFGAYCIS